MGYPLNTPNPRLAPTATAEPVLSDPLAQIHPSPQQSNRRSRWQPRFLQQLGQQLGQQPGQRLPWHAKLIAMAMMTATLPVLGAGTVAGLLANHTLNQQIAATETATAQKLSQRLEAFMMQRQDEITALVNLPALKNLQETPNTPLGQNALSQILESYRLYDSVTIFDLQGNPLVHRDQTQPIGQGKSTPSPAANPSGPSQTSSQTSSHTSGQNILLNATRRQAFRNALGTGRVLISRPVRSHSGQYVVYLTAATQGSDHRQRAIVQAVLSTERFADLLKTLPHPDTTVSLFDHNGEIFVTSQELLLGRLATSIYPTLISTLDLTDRPTDSEPQIQLIDSVQNRWQILPRQQWFTLYLPEISRTETFSPGWNMVLETPADTLFASQRQLLSNILLSTLILGLLAGLLTLVCLRRLRQTYSTASPDWTFSRESLEFDAPVNSPQILPPTRMAREAATAVESAQQTIGAALHHLLHQGLLFDEMARKIRRMGETTQSISQTVSRLDQRTVQTNFLTVNTGIEQAHMSQDSYGFAIVAEAVADLTAHTAAATREVDQIIATIQRGSADMVDVMEHAAKQVVEGAELVDSARQSLEHVLAVSRQIDGSLKSK